MQSCSLEAARKAGIFCWDPIKLAVIDPEHYSDVFIVHEWIRDCDMVESDRVVAYPATQEHLDAARDAMQADAEGPWRMSVISLERAKSYQPHTRDLVMEAYENGSPTAVDVTPSGPMLT